MDEMVLKTQQYLNAMYGGNKGYDAIDEDGKTGWATIYALTKAFQIELGITQTANNFGPTTVSLFNAQYPNGIMQQDSNDTTTSRVYAIIQGALWCKGYSTGASGITEHFYGGTGAAVKKLKEDAGYENPDSTVTLNIMKALLSMNQFVTIRSQGGTYLIRSIQQQLNRKYEDYIGLIPCDGLYGREMNKALIMVLQAIEGFSAAEATGTFGAQTKAKCPILPDTSGELTDKVVEEATYLLKYALCCNGYTIDINSANWDYSLKSTIKQFQNDLKLDVTETADINTWMSLLLSKGNPDRACTACDTRFEITTSRAAELKNKGYNIVGRYLTGNTFKVLRVDEPKRILDNGLFFFPIFQESTTDISYFTEQRGKTDARKAIQAARRFGIPEGNIIYFAVDLDATSPNIISYILPYFKALSEVIDPAFLVGVYGTRNVCTQVCEAGYAETCFVSDMSTGYSGNMGFRIPSNWNFDQYAEINMDTTIDGKWAIDKDAYSGRYEPVKELEAYIYIQPPKPEIPHSPTITEVLPLIENLENLYTEWYRQTYATEDNPAPHPGPRRLASGITNFLRSIAYTSIYWKVGLLSDINTDFISYVQNKSRENGTYNGLYDNLYQYMRSGDQVLISDEHDGLIDLKHMAATAEAYFSITSVPKSWVGWAGDLASSMKDTTNLLETVGGNCQDVADTLVGASGSQFAFEDMCGDADAIKIAQLITESSSSSHSFSESLREYYANYVSNRFTYILEDIGCSEYLQSIKDAVKEIMENDSDLILLYFGKNPSAEVVEACCNAFANYVYFEL